MPIDESTLPPDDLPRISQEERLESFGAMLRAARQGAQWESLLNELLDAFERFLVEQPEPPESWTQRLGEDVHRYDYYQLVLPGEYTDPYEDDLANVRILRSKFHGQKSFMALENFLVTRNHFLFGNGHAAPVCLPRPVVMLESHPESKHVDWDCTLTVYADGSWQSYNLEREDEENLGEDILENLGRWMPLIQHMHLVAPAEGRDCGWFQPREPDEEQNP